MPLSLPVACGESLQYGLCVPTSGCYSCARSGMAAQDLLCCTAAGALSAVMCPVQAATTTVGMGGAVQTGREAVCGRE